jgi:Flp pilus assembly protein TadD
VGVLDQQVQRAMALCQLGRHEEALARLGPLAAGAPDNARFRLLISECLGHLERWVPALEQADAVVRLAPEWPEGYRQQALLLWANRSLPEALAAAGQAVRVDPHSPDALNVLARIQLACGDVSGARSTARSLLTIVPDWPSALEVFGRATHAAGDFTQAEEAVRHGIALDPQDPELLLTDGDMPSWWSLSSSVGRCWGTPA